MSLIDDMSILKFLMEGRTICVIEIGEALAQFYVGIELLDRQCEYRWAAKSYQSCLLRGH